jgi:hypothetical protein
MAIHTPPETGRHLLLSAAETEMVLHLLEATLRETRVEVHHTHTPDYHNHLVEREELIRGLIERLKPEPT